MYVLTDNFSIMKYMISTISIMRGLTILISGVRSAMPKACKMTLKIWCSIIRQKYAAIIAAAVRALIDFTLSSSAFSFEKGARIAVMPMTMLMAVTAIDESQSGKVTPKHISTI